MKKYFLSLTLLFLFSACRKTPPLNLVHIVSADTVSEFKIFETKTFRLTSDSFSHIMVNTDSDMVSTWNNDTINLTAITEGKHLLQVQNSITKEILLDTIIDAFKNPVIQPDWLQLQPVHQPAFTSDHDYVVYLNIRKFHFLNQPFPPFKFMNAHGDTISNLNFKNHITFVNMWYYGCLPCIYELPFLNSMYDDLKNDPHFQFYSFFADSIFNKNDSLFFTTRMESTDGRVKPQYFHSFFIQIPNCFEFNRKMSINLYPTNILVDSHGIIRFVDCGASISNDNWENEWIAMMKEKMEGMKNNSN